MERLSALDTTFLHVEDRVSHMHLGSVTVYEGPAPAHDELLRVIESKLHLTPRYRQRVRFVPLGAARPVWADDPSFDLRHHVRRARLPAPGGDEGLRRLVGRVMSKQLDRRRPLWEMWVADGLEGDRWAIVSKLHHCMVDGVSASSLITLLMNPVRDADPTEPVPWTPEPDPGDVALVTSALADVAALPLHAVAGAAHAARAPVTYGAWAAAVAQGLAAYAGIARPPGTTALNGAIGERRRWESARAHLAEVKEIRTAFGGTVNDVVLDVIAEGFADLLRERGESTDRTLRTMVPVSVRAPGDTGPYNKVSTVFAELPLAIADPVERLAAISAQLRHLKATHEAVAGEALTTLAGFAPEALLSVAARVATRTPQHNVNTVTTNVPGPQRPLYLAGRRMLEAFPYVPIAGHVRIGVAIYSYDGWLFFGVTGDAGTAPDIGVLCAGIERGTAGLLAAARARACAPDRRDRARLLGRR
jgi:diacylglycerol O-acyltransferase